MVVEGRNASQIRHYNSFKLAVGLLLFVVALLSLLNESRAVLSVQAAPEPIAPTSSLSDNDSGVAIVATPTKAVATLAPTVVSNPPLSTPAFTTESGMTITVGNYFLISGTADPGVTIRIEAPDEIISEFPVDASGIWMVDVLFEVAGSFQLSAIAFSEDGRTATSTTNFEITALPNLDLAVTSPILEAPAQVEYDAGEIISFNGTGTPLAMLAVIINDVMFDAAPVDVDGRWEYRAQFPETGEYSVRVQLINKDIDEAILSETHSFAIVEPVERLNEPRPTVVATNILTPEMRASVDSGLFRGGTVSLTGRANPTRALEVVINRQIDTWLKPDDDGTWEHTIAIESPDTYSIYVRSVDADGSVLAYSEDSLILRLLAGFNDPATDPCEGFYSPGEFLPHDQYRVAQCETLSSIAERANTTTELIVAANSDLDDPRRISPGQLINLPELP